MYNYFKWVLSRVLNYKEENLCTLPTERFFKFFFYSKVYSVLKRLFKVFLSLDILIIHLDHSKCEILLFKGL